MLDKFIGENLIPFHKHSTCRLPYPGTISVLLKIPHNFFAPEGVFGLGRGLWQFDLFFLGLEFHGLEVNSSLSEVVHGYVDGGAYDIGVYDFVRKSVEMPFCDSFVVDAEGDDFYIFQIDKEKVLRLVLALRKRNIVD